MHSTQLCNAFFEEEEEEETVPAKTLMTITVY